MKTHRLLALLTALAALPISRWNFIGDAATPHLGSMAQDFHTAFGLGTDDKHIATVDADGVALAASQGLNQKLSEQEIRLKNKDSAIQELRQAVAELTIPNVRLVAVTLRATRGDALIGTP